MAFSRVLRYCCAGIAGTTLWMHYKWAQFDDGAAESLAIAMNRPMAQHCGGFGNTGYIPTKEKAALRDVLVSHDSKLHDVCVIGGGFAGVHVTLSLAEQGKDVVLLEARRLGSGASGRNGGFALAGFETDADDLAHLVGKKRAADLFHQSFEAFDRLKQLIYKYKIRCDAEESGGVFLEFKRKFKSDKDLISHQKEEQKNCERRKRDYGEKWSVMSSEELKSKGLFSERFSHGLHIPYSLSLNPLSLVLGLARACEQRGAHIFEMSEVVNCTRNSENTCWIVTTRCGSVRARELVLCTNRAPFSLFPRLALTTTSLSTGMFLSKPLPTDVLNKCLNTNLAVYDERMGLQYCRRFDGNRLLFGALAFASPVPLPRLSSLLKKEALKTFPSFAPFLELEVVWQGRLEGGYHQFPIVGRSPVAEGGVFYSLGFAGHGLVPTCAAGKAIADAIVSIHVNDPERKCNNALELWAAPTHNRFFQKMGISPAFPCFADFGIPAAALYCGWIKLHDYWTSKF